MNALQRGFLFFGGVALVLLVLTSTQAKAGEECQQLLRNKCANCHFVTHICSGIEKGKGSLHWRGVVHDMIDEGMVAKDQEQDRLVSCLADPDAPVKALCPVKK